MLSAPPDRMDTSTHILIGAGVLLVILSALMAVLGYHKKVAHTRARATQTSETADRRASSRSLPQSEDDRVRMAFAALLQRPSHHHRAVRISPSLSANLQAPPPYESHVQRPPSHLGFIAPTQPGYHPWMVRRHDQRRRRRRSRNAVGDSGQQQTEPSLPPEPPPYEEIIKDIEEREWILGPVLDAQTISTVSEMVQCGDLCEASLQPTGNPSAPVFDLIPGDPAHGGIVPTMPPGYISGGSPPFTQVENPWPETQGLSGVPAITAGEDIATDTVDDTSKQKTEEEKS